MPIYYKVIHGETIDKRKLKPFWVKNTSNSNMSIELRGDYNIVTSGTRKIYYSFNLTDWTEVDLIMNGNVQYRITLNPQNIVYIKSDPFNSNIVDNQLRITLLDYTTYNCGGNINSFVFGNEFTGEETSLNARVGVRFYNIIDASNMVLPATTLSEFCYANMFYNNTSLTNAPDLPATLLTNYCYYQMFGGCTSLTNVPELLPATSLAVHCYDGMFNNCKSMTKAPEIAATTLATYCCIRMFNNCTSLTIAPELLATTLISFCYQYMFTGCTSLNKVKCHATSYININSTTAAWLSNVASTGIFYKAAGVTWPTGVSGIPTGWTVEEI